MAATYKISIVRKFKNYNGKSQHPVQTWKEITEQIIYTLTATDSVLIERNWSNIVTENKDSSKTKQLVKKFWTYKENYALFRYIHRTNSSTSISKYQCLRVASPPATPLPHYINPISKNIQIFYFYYKKKSTFTQATLQNKTKKNIEKLVINFLSTSLE
jgi:hypothetical protein